MVAQETCDGDVLNEMVLISLAVPLQRQCVMTVTLASAAEWWPMPLRLPRPRQDSPRGAGGAKESSDANAATTATWDEMEIIHQSLPPDPKYYSM